MRGHTKNAATRRNFMYRNTHPIGAMKPSAGCRQRKRRPAPVTPRQRSAVDDAAHGPRPRGTHGAAEECRLLISRNLARAVRVTVVVRGVVYR